MWDKVTVTGRKNELHEQAHGWDVVHAAFATAYRKHADRFLAACDEENFLEPPASVPSASVPSAPAETKKQEGSKGPVTLQRQASFKQNCPAWSEPPKEIYMESKGADTAAA